MPSPPPRVGPRGQAQIPLRRSVPAPCRGHPEPGKEDLPEVTQQELGGPQGPQQTGPFNEELSAYWTLAQTVRRQYGDSGRDPGLPQGSCSEVGPGF